MLASGRRKRGDPARRSIAAGRDPIDDRRRQAKQTAGITFGVFAEQLISEISKGFRNAKHVAQWRSTLARYAAPLNNRPIDVIGTDDVLAVLQPIWTAKPETASRVRGRIERVLDAARAMKLREGENPARWRGHLDQLLSKRPPGQHHPALPFEQLPAFVANLRKRKANAALALEFLILTAARSGEVLGAKWSEIDRAACLWIVPASRMKSARDHRVPLTARALVILTEVEKLRRSDLVFPSYRADKPLSNMAFDALLGRMQVRATAHGFRSSFRDWVGETTAFPREVAEAALAHAVGDKTELAYRRGDALAKRRELMAAWERFCEGHHVL